MRFYSFINRRLQPPLQWFDAASRVIAALVMGQTLVFKFLGAPESVYIFSTLGAEPFGRIATGILELVASLLLLNASTAAAGALLGLGLMSGAVLSHLAFLGVEVMGDSGLLFSLALLTMAACIAVIWIRGSAFVLRDSMASSSATSPSLGPPRINASSCSIVPNLSRSPRVVVVGGGFGGLQVVRALRAVKTEVLLFDKRNYYLFQPLLYQVATAALNPSQIAVPLRLAAERQANASIYLAEVHAIDLARQRVLVGNERTEYAYDYLVLAAGVQTNYFGKDEFCAAAPGMKTIEEALAVRNKFLLAFEEAELASDPNVRTAVLTFAIVGGGPTGVELAGAMAEIARHTLQCSFRRFSATTARVILIDSGERILKTFSEAASRRAHQDLEELGVEIILNARVTDVSGGKVTLKSKDGSTLEILCRNVTWAAGVAAGALSRTLGVELDQAGRVVVGGDLSIPSHPNVFVIGDLAHYQDPKLGRQVPGVAQGAIQMGSFVGKLLAAEITRGAVAPRPTFAYFDKGSMATIGRGRAVVNIGSWGVAGLPAWLLWAVVHVAFLNGVRNRVNILAQWIWMFFFYELGVRLITREAAHRDIASMPPDPRLAKSPG